MDHFELVSDFAPTGDQPQAIEKLVQGFKEGNQFETLLGVTGSGKTFTMANVIQALNKPTLILAHNKTLAAQLYSEFKAFFPHNAVEYFVSYYDYYQPEAYVPSTDTYIEKDSSINDEIDKLRHSATAALRERVFARLFEAAKIDGANEFQRYITLGIPLCKPALTTVGIYTFIAAWSDYLAPLIYISSKDRMTLSLGLQQFLNEFTVDWTLLMAAAVIFVLPVVVLFFIFQRNFVEGVATSGLKA